MDIGGEGPGCFRRGSKHDPDQEIADLLKGEGIEKARLTRELTIDELKTGIALIKALKNQKAED